MLTQQGKGSRGWCGFPFNAYCLTSSFLWCSFLFFVLCSPSLGHPFLSNLLDINFPGAATLHFCRTPILSLSLSLPLILPPSLMSSLPNTLHISFPSLHLPLSLVLSPRPAPSNPLPADSAAGFWARTSLCVRWEQVTPQGPGWPHCVTFTPTQIKFVWDAASRLEAPFKLVWAWNGKSEPEAGNTGTQVYTTVRHTVSFVMCSLS